VAEIHAPTQGLGTTRDNHRETPSRGPRRLGARKPVGGLAQLGNRALRGGPGVKFPQSFWAPGFPTGGILRARDFRIQGTPGPCVGGAFVAAAELGPRCLGAFVPKVKGTVVGVQHFVLKVGRGC